MIYTTSYVIAVIMGFVVWGIAIAVLKSNKKKGGDFECVICGCTYHDEKDRVDGFCHRCSCTEFGYGDESWKR